MLRRTVLLGAALPFAGVGAAAAQRQPSEGGQVSIPVNRLPFSDLPDQGAISEGGDAYAATAVGLSQIAALTTQVIRDVPYGVKPAQRLDIYLPLNAKRGDTRPVLINIHGGAWRWGFKEWMGLNAPPILATGAIYVSIGYTLAPIARHPAQLFECAEAVGWVRRHIAEYGGNPDCIVLGGHSAGAHLASLLALRQDARTHAQLPLQALKGCVVASGAYDFRDPTVYGLPKENRFLEDYLARAEDATDASPIHWVAGNRIPFFVGWGGADRDDAKATGPSFAAALLGAGSPVESHLFPTFDHYWMHLAQQSPENAWTRAAIRFLKQ